MNTFTVVFLCVQACLIQNALSQCTSRAAVAASPGIAGPAYASNYGLAAPGYGLATPGYGLGAAALAAPAYAANYGLAAPGCGLGALAAPALDFSPTSGGGLPVSSASAIAPVGISVASENAYEGALTVAGELPFVGTVGLEGVLPTAGAGAVNHACGNGRNAMVSEGAAYPAAYSAAAIAPAAGLAPAAAYAGPAAAYTAPALAGFAAPAFAGYNAPGLVGPGYGFAGRGCGYAL